jgi:hypothetical protein
MKNSDKGRKWMWWFLGTVLAMQLYFVRELFAVFALFVLGFCAIALIVVTLYVLHQGWTVAVERIATSQHPVLSYARRQANSIEDLAHRSALAAVAETEELAKRAIRRAGSAAAR